MTKILLVTALAISSALAQYPMQDMNRRTLGVAVNGGFRGQNITSSNVQSHEIMPMLDLSYAPASWALLSLGLGYDRFRVDTYQGHKFNGKFGFAPQAGLYLYSPAFAKEMLRVTGGVVNLFMSCEDSFDYAYYGMITNPFAGLIFSPARYVDLGLGLRNHMIYGNSRTPGVRADAYFENQEIRTYFNLLVHSPDELVYLAMDLDRSPDMGRDWSKGPDEASIHLSIGFLLGWSDNKVKTKRAPVYFPEYGEVKDLEDRMSEDLK